MKRNTSKTDDAGIKRAIYVLERGGIIAFPTDTVYGVGCDASNRDAVKRIFRIKHRNRNKPLVMFISNKNEINKYVKPMTKIRRRIVEHLLPGAITLIFKAKENPLPGLLGDQNKISIRIPKYSFIRKLLGEYRMPLATTSANLSGDMPTSTYRNIALDVDLILKDDSIPDGSPSTVLDLSFYPPVLVRKGIVSIATIERYIPSKLRLDESIDFNVLFVCTGNSCRSPMAEGILKSLIKHKGLRNISVSSCGTLPGADSPATSNAIQAAGELGYDITKHRSRGINKTIIEQQDLILCMENLHKRQVLNLSSDAKDRVFLLSEFAGNHEEIVDPIGGNIDLYRKVARNIQRYTRKVANDIALRKQYKQGILG